MRGSLKGYLAICIANQARDRNRAGRRQPTVGLDDVATISSSAQPERIAISGELSEKLNLAMEREVIVLHLQTKMKFAQIALSQGVSVNTCQSRYRYGLEKLRSMLNSELGK